MPRFLRLVCGLFLPLLLVPAAQAEGLVQLTLRGTLATPGGAPVEVHVGFWDGAEVKAVDLRLHLAQSTTARDLGALLVSRLRKAGAEFEYTGENAKSDEPVQLFLESTTLISLRLGHGLTGSVTTSDSSPQSVRFLAPIEVVESAELAVCVTTFHPHMKKPGRIELSLQAKGDAEPSSLCEALFNTGLAKGLVSDRPSADRWHPTKTTEGAIITGCSIDLTSAAGDWGLEVQLSVPRSTQ